MYAAGSQFSYEDGITDLECVDECFSGGEGCNPEEANQDLGPPTQPFTTNSSQPSLCSASSAYDEYMTPSPPNIASTSTANKTTVSPARIMPPSLRQHSTEADKDELASFARALNMGERCTRSGSRESYAGISYFSKRSSVASRRSTSSSKATYSSTSSLDARDKPSSSLNYTNKRKHGKGGGRRQKETSYRSKSTSNSNTARRITYKKSSRSPSATLKCTPAKYGENWKRRFSAERDYENRQDERKLTRATKSRDRCIGQPALLSAERQAEGRTHLLVSPTFSPTFPLCVWNGMEEDELNKSWQDGWRQQQVYTQQLRQQQEFQQYPLPYVQPWETTPCLLGAASLQHYPTMQTSAMGQRTRSVLPLNQVSRAQKSKTPFWKSRTVKEKVPASAAVQLGQSALVVVQPRHQRVKEPIFRTSAGGKTKPTEKVLKSTAEKAEPREVKLKLTGQQLKAVEKHPKTVGEEQKAGVFQSKLDGKKLQTSRDQPRPRISYAEPSADSTKAENLEVSEKDNMDAEEAKKAVQEIFASSSPMASQERKQSRDYLEALKKQFPDLGVIAGRQEDNDMRELLVCSTSNAPSSSTSSDTDPPLHKQKSMQLSSQMVASSLPASPAGLIIDDKEEEPIINLVVPSYLSRYIQAKEQQAEEPVKQPVVENTCPTQIASPVQAPVKFLSPCRKNSNKFTGSVRQDPRVKKTSLEAFVVVKEEPREEGRLTNGVQQPKYALLSTQVAETTEMEPPASEMSKKEAGESVDNMPQHSKNKDSKIKIKPLVSATSSKTPSAANESQRPSSSPNHDMQHVVKSNIKVAQMTTDRAPNSLSQTVFTVEPGHPEGQVNHQTTDIALPNSPKPPVFLKNAPNNCSTTSMLSQQQEVCMDISNGKETRSAPEKKEAKKGVPRDALASVVSSENVIAAATPVQLDLCSPRISECRNSSNISRISGQLPKNKETANEAIENKISKQIKDKMQADFERQYNSMKSNYKGQIDELLKRIITLDNSLNKKKEENKKEKDTRLDSLLAEKAKNEGIINGLRTTLADNQAMYEDLQARNADQLMAKEQEMREREKDAVCRYLTEQNKTRNLERELQELRKRILDMRQSSDESNKLMEENCKLREELNQSKGDAASLQNVVEEAQIQLENDKAMLRHTEEEYKKRYDKIRNQMELDRQEIADLKHKNNSLNVNAAMEKFTLATEKHMRKCLEEAADVKQELTRTCQDYKDKMVAIDQLKAEHKITKAQLEGANAQLEQAAAEIAGLKQKLEDAGKKMVYEMEQTCQISLHMFEMEQKLNVEKFSMSTQTNIVQAQQAVELSVSPVNIVLFQPSSTASTLLTIQNNGPSSSGRKRSHTEGRCGSVDSSSRNFSGPQFTHPTTLSTANDSDEDIIYEKTVTRTKKLRTKSGSKISTSTVCVREVLAGPATSPAAKVPKRDVSDISATEDPDRLPESSSSPAVLIGDKIIEQDARVTSPDSSSSVPGNAPTTYLFQNFASQSNQDRMRKSLIASALPLQTQNTSTRASPSYSEASTVSPNTLFQPTAINVSSLANKQARYPVLNQALDQQSAQRYNLTGVTSQEIMPQENPNLAASQNCLMAQQAGLMINPMQDPQIHKRYKDRFLQLFSQENNQEVGAQTPFLQHPPPYNQQYKQCLPTACVNNPNKHVGQKPLNSSNHKVIAEANRVLEAFFSFMIVNAAHQPACCVLIPFCNSYNIPERERAGLLTQLEPLAYLFDKMKGENLETLRNRSGGNV